MVCLGSCLQQNPSRQKENSSGARGAAPSMVADSHSGLFLPTYQASLLLILLPTVSRGFPLREFYVLIRGYCV